MSNGNSVQSVSLADGTLSPDLRVNYTFGLVLGVNEFQQEQDYLLQKAYLYNRAFQGYGTVSGLKVTADWQKGEEILITVSPGMAIDQYGMPVVVRDAQCARLTAWLKKQEEQAGTIKNHRKRRVWEKGKKRDLRVYIIARYDDYADGQVPIAGQACNSADTQPIYSRMHDSYTIDFAWDPPAQPAWEGMRNFSKILERVRIKQNAEDQTNEIIEQVRKLAEPESVPSSAPRKKHDDKDGEHKDDKDDHEEHHRDDDDDDDDDHEQYWAIQADSARESLDRIFSIWVMEVRPKLLPDLLTPDKAGTNAQPDILLAHIDFTLDDDWNDSDPHIEEDGFDPPDNGGRPFLLPTQLMQELSLLGQQESVNIEEEGHKGRAHEFATLQVRNNHTLLAWVHYPRRLYLDSDNDDWGSMVEVKCDDRPLGIRRVREIAPNVFEIEIRAEEAGYSMNPGARVELTFKADAIRVERRDGDGDDEDEDEEEHEDLKERVEEKAEEAEHEIKEGAEKVEEEAHEETEKAEDVAKKVEGKIEEGAGDIVKDVGKVEERIGGFFKREFGFGRDMAEQGAKIKREGEEAEQKGEEKVIRADVDREQLAAQEVAEDVKEAQKEERERRPKLSKSMRWLGLNYVGYEHRDDSDERIIIVYIIAGHIPVRELATFFVYDAQTDMPNMPHAELRSVTTSERFLALWFHTEYPVVMPPQVRVVRTFVNQQSQELTLRAVAPAGLSASWYWALEPPEGDEELQLVPGELLAIIFDTNEIGVVVGENAWPLTVAMRETPFTCVGYDGDHTIVNYHQVGFPGRRGEGREPPTGKLAADQPSAPASNASVPVQPFVTITVTRLNQNDEGATRVELELWFHLSISHGDDRTVFTDDLSFEALLEDGRQLRTTRVEATTPTRVQQNVYTSTVTLPAPGESQRGYYLRLRFPLDVNPVNVRGVRTSYRTLREYIDATGIRFEGYNGDDSVLAYVRAAAPR